MNKAFCLIWNNVKQAWVIAAEVVKGSGGPAPVTVTTLLMAVLLQTGIAVALPTAPQVINGTATINTVGSVMTVTNSPSAIINWGGFSIAANETTKFIQQSAASAVLNRVIGGDPSLIYGTLQSNGKVFLINQNGILIGPGAQINVGGLVASTLNITNQDFLAGRMQFNAGPLAGKIENQGTITTPKGGEIYLIAPDVTNKGIITAPNGDILLAAGNDVLLVEKTTPEIALVVSAPEHQAINLGQLSADAGRVGMYGGMVRQAGVVSANAAVQDAQGRIFLKATRDVTLEKGSLTTATGPKGGTIQVTGQHAGLIDNSVVDVSGTAGGGTVLVGGDYQGKNSLVQNAEAVYMGTDVAIKADATDNGSGGKVILWSDNVTRAYGSISARGGVNGGNGGFVETSGKVSLDANGIRVSTAAPAGVSGTWLLDPSDITITSSGIGSLTGGVFDPAGASGSISWSTIEGGLAGGNVTIQTSGGTGGNGDIVADDGYYFANAGAGVLTLIADRDITLNRTSMDLEGNPQGLTLLAGRNVAINNSISIANVNVTATTGYISASSTSTISTTSPSGIALNAATGIYGQNNTTALQIEDSSLGKLKLAVHNSGVGPIRIADGSYAGLEVIGATQTTSGQLISISTSGGMIPDLLIAGTVSAPGGTIELNAARTITQTAAISGGGLNVTSAWGATLNHASNMLSSFSANNATSGDISLVNTAATLTLNGLNIDNAGGGNVTITNSGALNTVGWVQTSGNGSISLAANGGSATIGNSLITGSDNTSTGSVTVTATGTTSDINLNNINVYSGSTGGGSGAIAMTAGREIKLNPAELRTTGNITLTAGGVISEVGAGAIHGASLAASSVGGMMLMNNNTAGSVQLDNSGGGSISYRSSRAGGIDLSVQNSAAGGAVTIEELTGGLLINQATSSNAPMNISAIGLLEVSSATAVSAGTGQLRLAGGSIVLGNLASLTGAPVLLEAKTVGSGSISFGGNSVAAAGSYISARADGATTFGATTSFNAPTTFLETFSDDRAITLGGTGSGLSITGIALLDVGSNRLVVGNPNVGDSSTTTDIDLKDAVYLPGGQLLMGGTGTISQTSPGIITADTLGLYAGGSISLGLGNSIQNLAAVSGSGAITINSGSAFKTVSLSEGSVSMPGLLASNQNITLTTSGSIDIEAPINAGTGGVALTSSSGSIFSSNGTGQDITAQALNLASYSGIGTGASPLNTSISILSNATSSMSGGVYITNSLPATILAVSAFGDIVIDNTGALTTSTNLLESYFGSVSLTAHSPLTIGSGGVSAANDVSLTAAASGGTDTLTLDGLVSAGGTLSLSAGGLIVENVAPSAVGGITRTANLNGGGTGAAGTAPTDGAVTETLNTLVNDTLNIPDTSTAPAGLVLVALAPAQDDATSSGETGSKEEDEKRDGVTQEKKPDDKGVKEDKPKKNYCN